MALAFVTAMDSKELRVSGLPIDRFAWQYSFYAYLIYRQAPASEAQLSDLAQVLHAIRGYLDPIEAAELVMLTWPFAVTE